MRLVGLTGGIASGKSTFARELQTLGIPVLDADDLARVVVDKGRWGYRRVVKAFGDGILDSNGCVDRVALGELVFRDAEARKRLNRATHVPILFALIGRIAKQWVLFQSVLVVDMALLFESGFFRVTSPRVLVAASPETQEARLMRRDGLSAAAARQRIEAQMPVAAKRKLADIVVENDGDRGELEEAARTVAAVLKRKSWIHTIVFSPLGVGLALIGFLALR